MYHDDNYGYWHDTDQEEVQDFYREVQRKSVKKKCSICGKTVRILPQYDKCNSCCERIEGGFDF